MGFHGVDYQEIKTGPVQVSELPTAITFLVGTAPKGPLNQLILVSNMADASQFGSQLPGFTIPSALATHFAEGGQPVMVVNVFDPVTDTTAVASESITLSNGKGKTAFAPVSNFILKHTTGTPIYVKDTDYRIDDYGNISSLNNATIAAGATVTAVYNKINTASVTAADIIGTVDGVTGARTGMKTVEAAYNLYGKEPKILIAPGFSELTAVVAEMRYWANRLLAMAIVDAPVGTTVPAAIAGRGPAGVINFNVSDERVILAYPRIKSYDPASNTDIAKPYSQYLSGIIGRVDTDSGFFYSFSNKAIRTASGTELPISSSAVNDGTDGQKLNDAGIVTVYNEGASGFRTWGNRNSAYPANSTIMTFNSTRRVIDTAIRAIQLSSVQYLDLPMTEALRDAIRETANNYVRSLIGRGALADGEAIYDPALNPPSEIAQGHWTFTLDWVPTPPLEHITYRSYVNITLLSKLNEVA